MSEVRKLARDSLSAALQAAYPTDDDTHKLLFDMAEYLRTTVHDEPKDGGLCEGCALQGRIEAYLKQTTGVSFGYEY